MFSLADNKGRFIYEICPMFFGSQITISELEYWAAFFVIQKAEMYEANSKSYDIMEVIEEINEKVKERNKSLKEHSHGTTKRPAVYSR